MEKINSKAVSIDGIPFGEVYEMVKAYHEHSSKAEGFDANSHVRCVWFPIQQIQSLANKLESEGADGLRIYFGRYPADVSKFQEPLPEPNTNTVILVSTHVAKGIPKSDYFVETYPIEPENRGEQCQPHCGGTSGDLNFE